MSVPEPTGADLGRRRRAPLSRRVLHRGVRVVPELRVPESSVRAVAHVARTDGRTAVQAYRTAGGVWCRPRRPTRFTEASISWMRAAGVAEVVLRRRLRRASIPLSWIP